MVYSYVFSIWCSRLFLNTNYNMQTMETPFVLPLNKIWTSFSALFSRYYFQLAKSWKLDDAFPKAADLLYLECQSLLTNFKRSVRCYFQIRRDAPFSHSGTNFIELFNIPRYISLKLVNSVQTGCMHVVNAEERIVPSAKVSGRLSFFKGYPVFARQASLAGEN